MEYFHSVLRPFCTKLVLVPGLWEPGTRTNFVQKAVKDYESILLCLRNAEKWIVKRVPGSWERNPMEPGTLTPLS
jgi:hypothetical protein